MTTRPLPTSSTSQDIVQSLAALGARYDAAPLFPVDSLAALTCAGLHRRFAPRDAGGEAFADEAARNAALADSLRLVGQGDLSIGRLFEGHVNALCLFDWYATRDQLDWLDRALTEEAWFGVWATEPSPGVQHAEGCQDLCQRCRRPDLRARYRRVSKRREAARHRSGGPCGADRPVGLARARHARKRQRSL